MDPVRRSLLLSPLGALAAGAVYADDEAKPAAKRQGLRRDDAWLPKLSENLNDVEPGTLRWLKQIGCRHVIFQGTDAVDRGGKGYWTAGDVAPIKKNCDQAGLVLESMMIPIDSYKRARFGQEGRDEEIENVCRTIRAVAEAGVPMMEWRFWPDFYWDDRVGYYETPGR